MADKLPQPLALDLALFLEYVGQDGRRVRGSAWKCQNSQHHQQWTQSRVKAEIDVDDID